ncbi:28S ribosomal protein S28, mitochondrial [Schistocerca cancellata]|uniref:28S ribosomal protein S28, mitochondrial n=1 Tax=Schistocerca cancellata TaxID=274614 RepID=UPI002117F5C4|nr:28S ribosomal protein S28, mitochondrial [Schistocerca cancellata]
MSVFRSRQWCNVAYNCSIAHGVCGRKTVSRRHSVSAGSGSTEEDSREEKNVKLSGFAKAFAKYTSEDSPAAQEQLTFPALLRNSKFIDLGDPVGKVVEGTIFHVVDDDLYVDFGWKFHCVCQRPPRNGSDYVRGARVRIRIKDLELSSKFLGSSRDLTLLEADATLMGIISSPARTSVK